jgi:hypothetical protein
MSRLEAKYEINLGKGEFLINRPISNDLTFRTEIDGFDVELHVNPEKSILVGPRTVLGDEEYYPTSKIRIIVTRNENIAPPTPELVNGHLNFEGLHPYYNEREPAYRKAALQIINRAIFFFKYRLHNPNLFELSSHDVKCPEWKINGGNYFSPTICLDSRIYCPKKGVGIEHLSRQHDADLESALQCPIQPELSEELMSDAQSAIFHNNLRRAVLEMAIACETAVKQAFFAKVTPAGAAYEYLEEKRNVRVPVKDMVDAMAKQAFGKSFKEDEKAHYEHVDFLFRCRNKVAHRGELTYRDDSGVVQSVNNDILADWWESAMALLKWLNANTPAKYDP